MRAHPDPNGGRRAWGLPAGGSGLYGHGSNAYRIHNSGANSTADVGPSYAGDPMQQSGDRVQGCSGIASTAAQMFALGMGCIPDSPNGTIGPRCSHSGGFQTVFCDGSLRWIDNMIQVGNGGILVAATNIGDYEMLFLASDGGTVPQDAYNN
jgi:prepilin-type processing-associated H-X9-DG protein